MFRPVLPTAAVLTAALLCVAERGVANDAIPSAAAGVPAVPKPPRLLVLRDGKVVEGDIRFVQQGYEVAVAGGRFVLSEPFVWFTASSRQAAYAELCQRLPDKSANGHVALARWCIDNRLYSDAASELKIALQLEPDHIEARKTLVSVERQIIAQIDAPVTGPTATEPVGRGSIKTASAEVTSPSPGESAASPGARSAADSTRRPLASEQLTHSRETLGGLPPEAARDFVSRVQPILMNGCANAGCHGRSSTNSFRIENVRLGNPGLKSLTQRNLDAVRAQLRAGSLHSSPLLVAARTPGHGGSRRPLFAGPAGQAQLRTLVEWAAIAVRSLPEIESPPGEIGAAGELFQASFSEEPAETVNVERAPIEQSTDAIAIEPASGLLRRVLEEERPDAFDPDEFNRRFAPQPDPRSPSSGDGPTP